MFSIVVASIYIPTNSERFFFSPRSLQHLLFVDFLTMAIMTCPWRRKWQPMVFLPGEPHGQRNLAGYSPWCRKSWTRLSN